jgi:Flp pilus assembly protein TadG
MKRMPAPIKSNDPGAFFAPRLFSFRRSTRLAQNDQGLAAVEFALLSPILILMFVCLVDLGLAVYTDMQVTSAAQAGAQYAMAKGFDASAISTAVTSATSLTGISLSPAPSQSCGCASASGITSAACTATCADGSHAGTFATVTAQRTYSTLLPYPIIPHSYTFSSQATVRLQ